MPTTGAATQCCPGLCRESDRGELADELETEARCQRLGGDAAPVASVQRQPIPFERCNTEGGDHRRAPALAAVVGTGHHGDVIEVGVVLPDSPRSHGDQASPVVDQADDVRVEVFDVELGGVDIVVVAGAEKVCDPRTIVGTGAVELHEFGTRWKCTDSELVGADDVQIAPVDEPPAALAGPTSERVGIDRDR